MSEPLDSERIRNEQREFWNNAAPGNNSLSYWTALLNTFPTA